ncbi:vesicle-associated membrane protein 5-like, partial [Syngnathus acus]|uniref:vesicle-associated membrane protein 5-like n=1 Tax=Syngnathus acus TaxID=161584 RepID=UPI001885EEF2
PAVCLYRPHCVFAKQNGKSRLQQAQEDAEEVKDIMLDNWNKAEERCAKLSDLEERADELLRKGKTFEKTTRKLNKKKSNQVKEKTIWKNKKVKIVLIAVVVALIVVGLIIYYSTT